jgi:hypothetical protein
VTKGRKKGRAKAKKDSERQYIPNISAQPALGKSCSASLVKKRGLKDRKKK